MMKGFTRKNIQESIEIDRIGDIVDDVIHMLYHMYLSHEKVYEKCDVKK